MIPRNEWLQFAGDFLTLLAIFAVALLIWTVTP